MAHSDEVIEEHLIRALYRGGYVEGRPPGMGEHFRDILAMLGNLMGHGEGFCWNPEKAAPLENFLVTGDL